MRDGASFFRVVESPTGDRLPSARRRPNSTDFVPKDNTAVRPHVNCISPKNEACATLTAA